MTHRQPSASMPVQVSLLITLFATAAAVGQTAVDSVLVDEPGNVADTSTGWGAVPAKYAIGLTEVTNSQYAAFLNAVADVADANGLWDPLMSADPRGGILKVLDPSGMSYAPKTNMGNKPVNFVTWFDAARFCNWLHNGQPFGMQDASTTEDGAYTLAGTNFVPRNPGAKWFLPNEDEWYKAAYHDSDDPAADGSGTIDYWFYPTRSDTVPTAATADATGNVSNPGPNVANFNFNADWNGQDGHVTTVGTAGNSSRYGTLDQAGDIDEWIETPSSIVPFIAKLRGGAWDTLFGRLSSASVLTMTPTSKGSAIGFRVAAKFVKSLTFSVGPLTTGVTPPPQNDVFLSPNVADLYISNAQLRRDTTNKGNMLGIDADLEIGLQVGDDVDALQGPIRSFPLGRYRFIADMVFSVAPGSIGQPGTPVNAESPTNAADLFETITASGVGHALVLPERAIGLDETNASEDLDALSLEPDAPFAAGTRIWFSLKRGSPTLALNGWSPADVLTAVVGSPVSLARAISAADLGLDAAADDLNALLMVHGEDLTGDGDFDDPGESFPYTYFSVDPLSVGAPGTPVNIEATNGTGAACDIFLTGGFGIQMKAYDGVTDLQLDANDDIDALEAPQVQCDNYPLIDFEDLPPPPDTPPMLPPGTKYPTDKVPLCFVIAVCDTPFPKKWNGSIMMDVIDLTTIPPTKTPVMVNLCKNGGGTLRDKAQALAQLFLAVPCPTGGKMFQKAEVKMKPAKLDPCIQNDPQANRIVGQVTVWVDPMCLPNAVICDLKISLVNWTISIVKPVPAPPTLTQCDRRIPGFRLVGTPLSEKGVFEIAFGTGDPNDPQSFVPSVPYGPSSDPVLILEDMASQIRAVGGVAGVLYPLSGTDPPTLFVDRTHIDHPLVDGEIGGPVVIEGGAIDDGLTTSYLTPVVAAPIDCNGNQIPDRVDVLGGASPDLNENGIPDECDPSLLGDFDGDGDVDTADFAVLAQCFGGANLPPAPGCPPDVDADLDDDNDVDTGDFAIFAQNFTGSN